MNSIHYICMLIFSFIVFIHPVFYAQESIRPGAEDWPVAWVTYRQVKSIEDDFRDLKAHGVGLVSLTAKDVAEAKRLLELCRREGMKVQIDIPDVTRNAILIEAEGLKPVDAIMIGGVYLGKAIDRHVFKFEPHFQEIVIEPPVYNKAFAYSQKSSFSGPGAEGEPIAHYYPDMPDPIHAEVIVPLKAFDGRQHLKIVRAFIAPAPPRTKPIVDSVTPDMPPASETRNRKLYHLKFDLTGLDDALLDQVGLAVYWPVRDNRGQPQKRINNASAIAPSTHTALGRISKKVLRLWTDANDGTFPGDVIIAARFGDEGFYRTGHIDDSPVVNYPLWDYCKPFIEKFKAQAGDIEYPRTWGFPEIYGVDAYAWWLYTLHQATADLAGIIQKEIQKLAPGLLLFRNTTRADVFSLSNDHDGSGPELLVRNLDIVHLDPYPVKGSGYEPSIPRDMSYYGGLARRYNRILVPWLQAHTYGGPNGLIHVASQDVDRMAAEHWQQGIDAVMWLGYGPSMTFPNTRPDSWEQAAIFHQKLKATLPPKPQPKMAVLRSYRAWALSNRFEQGKWRNPADWLLQQLLEVWAVKHSQPYDVFELPPILSAKEHESLENVLKAYPYIASNIPWQGAWIIGDGTRSTVVDLNSRSNTQEKFEKELFERQWLDLLRSK